MIRDTDLAHYLLSRLSHCLSQDDAFSTTYGLTVPAKSISSNNVLVKWKHGFFLTSFKVVKTFRSSKLNA